MVLDAVDETAETGRITAYQSMRYPYPQTAGRRVARKLEELRGITDHDWVVVFHLNGYNDRLVLRPLGRGRFAYAAQREGRDIPWRESDFWQRSHLYERTVLERLQHAVTGVLVEHPQHIEAFTSYLDFAAWLAPSPKVQILVRCTEDLRERLQRAVPKGGSINELVVRALETYINQE